MAKVIAIVNQKGGVGKTTTTINLGACFARKGERVLLIDMDGQGNMSRGLGCKVKRNQYTIRNALVDIMNGVDVDPMKGIVPAKYDPLHIMPADKQLLAFERSLKNEPEAPYLLRGYVEKLQWSFDRILIDCSPSLGVLTQNALVGSNSVMIPVDPEFFGMEGVEQITSTMNDVKRKMNPELYLEGIVIVRRNNVSIAKRTNAENLRLRYEDKVHRSDHDQQKPRQILRGCGRDGADLCGSQSLGHRESRHQGKDGSGGPGIQAEAPEIQLSVYPILH